MEGPAQHPCLAGRPGDPANDIRELRRTPIATPTPQTNWPICARKTLSLLGRRETNIRQAKSGQESGDAR
jgi:hypothetical protein